MPPQPPPLSLSQRVKLHFRCRVRRIRRRCRQISNLLHRTLTKFPCFYNPDIVPADSAKNLEGEVIGSYRMLSEINKGTFGSVYRCCHITSGKTYAAKYYSLDWIRTEHGMSMTGAEMQVMQLLNHGNTTSLQEILFMSHGILLVMELVDGRNLLEILPRHEGIMEPFARHIFRQFLHGLQYLHRHRIVHRDIKLENVMLDHDANVKIIDYGLAEYVPRNRRKCGRLVVNNECGSLNYLAPEVMMSCGQYYRGDLTDIWASGILLYVLVTGYFPFDHDDEEQLRSMIHSADEHLEDALNTAKNMSPELKDLLRKLLVKRASKRLSIADMMVHPWLKGTKLETEQPTVETFSSSSGKISVTFRDKKPDCSLTLGRHAPGKKGSLNRQKFSCHRNRSIPPSCKYGMEDQSEIDSVKTTSSAATTASGKLRKRDLSKLLSKIFRSSKRMIPSRNLNR